MPWVNVEDPVLPTSMRMAFAMIKNRLDVRMMQPAITTQMQRPMMVLVLSWMNAENAAELEF